MRRIHQTPRIYYVRTTLGRYESLVSSKSIHYIYVPALDPTYIILIQLLVNYLYNKTKGLIWFPLCYIHVFRVLGIIQKPQCFLENFVYLAMWIITYYVITNEPTGLLLHFLENILKTTTSRGGQYCTALQCDLITDINISPHTDQSHGCIFLRFRNIHPWSVQQRMIL